MKKKIASIAIVLTMAVGCAACGSKEQTAAVDKKEEVTVSASEVMNVMADASQDIKGINMTMNVNLDMENVSTEEKMGISGSMDIKGSKDPANAYVNLDLSVNTGGEEENAKAEAYALSEEDGYKVYFGVDGEWMMTSVSMDDLGIDMSAMNTDLSSFKEYFSDENVETYFENVKVTETEVDGKTCYSVSGDLSEELMSLALDALKEYGVSDISGTKVSLEICSEKESGLPVSMGVKINVGENETVKVNNCEFNVKYNSYEEEDITIPDEAKDAAEINLSDLYNY